MNPLLSLSSVGQVTPPSRSGLGAEHAGTAADNAGQSNQFSHFLSQSGQQQAGDRQSFAGYSGINKSKKMASMEGAGSTKPEITLPPVTPPEATISSVSNKTKQRASMEGADSAKPEITLPPVTPPEAAISNVSNKTKRWASMEGADSAKPEITLPPVTPPDAAISNVSNKTKQWASMEGADSAKPEITLPPVIDPQARLDAMVEDSETDLLVFLDLASITRPTLLTQAEHEEVIAAKAQEKPPAENSAASKSGIGGKTEWSALPIVTEQIFKTGAADSDGIDSSATVKLSSGDNNITMANNQSPLKFDTLSQSLSARSLESISAAGNSTATPAVNLQTLAAKASFNESELVTKEADNNKTTSQGAKLTAHLNAENDITLTSETLGAKIKLATNSDSTQNGALQREKSANDVLQPGQNIQQGLEAQSKTTQANLEIMNAVSDSATLRHMTEVTAATKATAINSAAQPLKGADVVSPLVNEQAGAATTIFYENAATIFGTPGQPTDEIAAATVISSTVAADAIQTKQQRVALAEAISQSKQALTSGSELTEQSKNEISLSATSSRSDLSVNGFSTIFGQATVNTGFSQSEAVAARLDAATVNASQHAADGAKAQSVTKSVTEQLKQLNLLEQNAAGQLKERINLMVRQNIQVADIRLDPADLGQMQIRVNLQQEQASVQFIVQQQQAKELLEQQMPRLREMLQQQGIQLGEGQVQHQRQGDSQTNGQHSNNSGSGQPGGHQQGDEQATAVQLDVKLSERLVDYYA